MQTGLILLELSFSVLPNSSRQRTSKPPPPLVLLSFLCPVGQLRAVSLAAYDPPPPSHPKPPHTEKMNSGDIHSPESNCMDELL